MVIVWTWYRTHLMPHWNPLWWRAERIEWFGNLEQSEHTPLETNLTSTVTPQCFSALFKSLPHFSDLIPLFPIPCFFALLSSTPLSAIVCFILSWFFHTVLFLLCVLFFCLSLPPLPPPLSQTHAVSLEMSWPLLEMAFWPISSWQARLTWQDSVRAPQNK